MFKKRITPIIKQYLSIKSKYLDTLLFYQVGDFYEFFYDDAKKISSLLNITLTSRNYVNYEKIPMAGIPVDSSKNYILKLIKMGESVVICNQIYTKSNYFSKELMQRKVVRVITPGTVSDNSFLNDKVDNLIVSLFYDNKLDKYGCSSLDIFSGKFYLLELTNVSELISFLLVNNPAEILYPVNFLNYDLIQDFNCIRSFSEYSFNLDRCYSILLNHFKLFDLSVFGITKKNVSVRSAGCLLEYVKCTQLIDLIHVNKILLVNNKNKIFMNASTIRNLELVDTVSYHNNTLFSVLDSTVTYMGSRMLKRWILSPLSNVNKVYYRHNIMEIIKDKVFYIRDNLKGISDLERIVGRIVLKNTDSKDLFLLRNSLMRLKKVIFSFRREVSLYLVYYFLLNLSKINSIINLLNESIVFDSTLIGNKLIKDGYNKKLDKLRSISNDNELYLRNLEIRERNKTGIKKLYVKFSRVNGYYLQVSKSESHLVPKYYLNFQSLKYVNRYFLTELKEYESNFVFLKHKIFLLEKVILDKVLDFIISNIDILKILVKYVAELDVLSCFVLKSLELNYNKPVFIDSSSIKIINGRHPVLEYYSNLDFVSNDFFVDNNTRLLVITGPNMSGKSTYMRQVALICIMAYIGCYIPADSCVLGPIDKILTRIGFSDDISIGKSTFMVEMQDISTIINSATVSSLILIDEMGRGTSFIEGISLSWSCLEYLVTIKKCIILFSTHYLELTYMSAYIKKIKNIYLGYLKVNNNLILLYKIKCGVCCLSFSLDVAKKVGIPRIILKNSYIRFNRLSKKFLSFSKSLFDVFLLK